MSPGKQIQIQSNGEVVFDGTQISGDIIVYAKGEIKENNPTVIRAYKDGVHDVKKTENKVRTINKPVTKTRRVNKPRHECVRRCPPLGCCGSDNVDHWEDETYVENVPTEESYIQESTVQEVYFRDVTLKTSFAGDSFANSNDLKFKETWSYVGTPFYADHLNFYLPSDPEPKLYNEYKYITEL